MQADYQIFPRRNGRSDPAFRKKWELKKYFTNFYQIQINQKKGQIYQYAFNISEEIPHESQLYEKCFESARRQLKEEYGYVAHRGQIFFGTKLNKINTQKKIKFKHKDVQYQFVGLIKNTKELNLADLSVEEYQQIYLQFLNIDLKNILKTEKMMELGKMGVFFPKNLEIDLEDLNLTILRGFKFTLVPLKIGVCLQVDVCSRVLQSNNLLQAMSDKVKQQVIHRYTNNTVITKYGRYRTYSIVEIDYNLSPKSTFLNTKKGIQMSYRDYYRQLYGIKIENTNQPLLKVIGKYNQVHVEEKGRIIIKKIPEYIYLIPELVSLTGVPDQIIRQSSTMKALSPHTKLSPDQRIEKCEEIISIFKKNQSLIQIKNVLKAEGYLVDKPIIKFQSRVKAENNGIIKGRARLKQPHHFKQWMLVYSCDNKFASKVYNLLQNSGKVYGILYENPIKIQVQVDYWIRDLKKNVSEKGLPEIIVFYLTTKMQEKQYANLKRFVTNQLKIPSQFIRKKTIMDKSAMSAVSKIGIQMNVKIGSAPWQVQKNHEFFSNKNLMYGALSLSKGKQGFVLAFVGTINNSCTRVFSDVKLNIQKKEEIPVEILEKIFIEWAKSYYIHNEHKLPQIILLYREGLSNVQAQDQLSRTEIPALKCMIQKICEKTKAPNYYPQVIVVTVNKRINTRYFSMGHQNNQDPNKFTPKLFNPDSGSVMIQSISSSQGYDFHLAAQRVTQGTCTPTLFKVAYFESKMPIQALISFTFEQCFNYYNWEGAVRVPACLQCADKLSKLFGQYIRQNPNKDNKDNPLMKKHFFL